MKGLILFIGIIAVIVFTPLAINNTAFAQCRSVVSEKALVDTLLPVYSGTYDPCDNWMKWTMSFTRSQVPDDNTGIAIEVSGTSVYETFMDFEYEPGNYSEWDIQYVGPSSSHELILDKTIDSNGQFIAIEGTVRYYASNPG